MVLSGQFLFDRDFDSDDPEFERRKREREQQERRERARYLGKSEAEAEVEAQMGNTDDGDAAPSGGEAEEDEPAGPPLAYSEEAYQQAVEEARQAGYKKGEKAGYKQGRKDGQREGKQEAERSREKQLQKSLDALAKKLPALLDEERDALAEVPGTAARIGVAIARAMFPHLAQQHGLDEIEAVLRQRIVELIDEPRLIVKVAPAIREDVAERAQKVARESGFDQRMAVVADANLGPADVKLEWSNGGAERIMERLWRDTEEAVQRTIGDGPTEFPQDDAAQPADAAAAEAPTLAEDDPQPEPEPEPEPAPEPEPEPEADAPASAEASSASADGPATGQGECPDTGHAEATPAASSAKDAELGPASPADDAAAGATEAEAAEAAAGGTTDAETPAASDASQQQVHDDAAGDDAAAGAADGPADGGSAAADTDGFEQGNILSDGGSASEAVEQAKRPAQRREMGAAIRDFDSEEEAAAGTAGAGDGAGLDQALQEFATDDDDRT